MAVVLPFVVAMLLATLLRPVAARLERGGMRPALAAAMAVALAVAVLAVLLSLDPAAVHRPPQRPRDERAGGRRTASPTRSASASPG